MVLAGRLQWELTGGTVVHAAKDDIVWVPRGTVHHIQNVGADPSLRLAVAMPPAAHYFHVRPVRLHRRRAAGVERLTRPARVPLFWARRQRPPGQKRQAPLARGGIPM